MKALFRICLLLGLAFGLGTLAPRAQATVSLNISVKVILNSSNEWPVVTNQVTYHLTNESDIRQRVAEFNDLFDRMAWGFRFNLTDITTLSGVSEWFDTDTSPDGDFSGFKLAVDRNHSKFHYREDAINIYINGHQQGRGITSTSTALLLLQDLILLNQKDEWQTMLHEFGHAMGLDHTHGQCNDEDDCGYRWRNDDRCDDTIYDYPHKSRQEIALYNFNVSTNNLTDDQRRQVDDVYYNLMSYHEPSIKDCRLTHDQWMLIVNALNDPLRRRIISSGSTVFVDKNKSDQFLTPCEVMEKLDSLVGGWAWPVSLYADWIKNNPLSPEYYFRSTCNSIIMTPPWPAKPDWWPHWPPPDNSSWPWPPVDFHPPYKPDDWPSDWTWLPDPPDTLTICFGGQYRTIQNGLDCAAADGDRLQIKAGHYNETMRINRPMTLTADRDKRSGEAGNVTIGRN